MTTTTTQLTREQVSKIAGEILKAEQIVAKSSRYQDAASAEIVRVYTAEIQRLKNMIAGGTWEAPVLN